MSERNVLAMISELREAVGRYGWWNLCLSSEGDQSYRLSVNVRREQETYSSGTQLVFQGPDIVDVLERATAVVLLMSKNGAISA